MQKVLVSLAIAASAAVFASPASAQYYPQPQPQPQGHAYGYHDNYQNNWGHVRSLQARIDNVQRQISRLDSRNRVTEREARQLMKDSREIEQRLRKSARNGLNQREAYAIDTRIQRLEQRMWRDARDGRNWSRRGDDDGRRGHRR